MVKYVFKRIGLMIITFFIIFIMVFVLIKLLPLEPLVGTETQIMRMQAVREAFGYNKPILEQFVIYLKQVFVHGSFGVGEKMYTSQDVVKIFTQKLPFTLYINIFALLIAIPVGIGLGIIAALKKNKIADNVISTLVMVGVSVPSFVFAFLIQYFLCHKLKVFPTTLMSGTGAAMFTPKYFRSALPPILALSLGIIAGFARFSRAELTEVLTSEFMLLARTKGLTRRQATIKHALKNAMVPIFPMIVGEFISIMIGSLIIEQVFGVPGIGKLFLQSINELDYNFFLMMSAFYTFIGLAAGIIIDLSYGFIDPRIRMGAGKK